MNLFHRLLTSIVLSIAFSQYAIAQYSIKVVDQNQNPVQDAVVSFKSTEEKLSKPEIAVMDQVEQQFTPKVLVIEKDQQVIFPNSDNTRHHVYSFSTAKNFQIKLYSGTPNTPITFDKTGVVTLGCNIHDDMVAYIYVNQKEVTALTNKDGIASLKQAPKELASLWHFDMQADDNKAYELKQIDENNWSIVLPLIERQPIKQNTFKARYSK